MKNRKLSPALALLPAIWALAWPTMLEQLMHTAVQYIDTAMVGALGTQATAAVGATSTVNWLVGSTISAVGVGFLALISQSLGAGDKKMTSRAAAQATLAVLVCGSLFTAITLGLSGLVPRWMQVDESIQKLSSTYFFIIYAPMLARTASIIFGTVLRAAGDTKTPMRAGIWTNIINVVLNFLLIHPTRTVRLFGLSVTLPGAGWGVIGAGIASAISFVVGGLLITRAVWRHPQVSPKGHSLKPDWEILSPCLRVAAPNALQRFGTSLGYVFFASMINSLGDISTAAHTIANTVESAFYIPGYGMQAAAATLAGNAYGAGDKDKIKSLARMTIAIEVGLMILSGGLLFLLAPQMMSIFSKDQQVIELGARVLRMVAISEPFFGVSIVVEGMMHGMGNTVVPFACNITGMWGIRILGTFLCIVCWNMGLTAAWACMILHNLMLFAVFMIFYATGKWIPKKDRIGAAQKA